MLRRRGYVEEAGLAVIASGVEISNRIPLSVRASLLKFF